MEKRILIEPLKDRVFYIDEDTLTYCDSRMLVFDESKLFSPTKNWNGCVETETFLIDAQGTLRASRIIEESIDGFTFTQEEFEELPYKRGVVFRIMIKQLTTRFDGIVSPSWSDIEKMKFITDVLKEAGIKRTECYRDTLETIFEERAKYQPKGFEPDPCDSPFPEPFRSEPFRSEPSRSEPSRSEPSPSDLFPSDPFPSETDPIDTDLLEILFPDPSPSETKRSKTKRSGTKRSGTKRTETKSSKPKRSRTKRSEPELPEPKFDHSEEDYDLSPLPF